MVRSAGPHLSMTANSGLSLKPTRAARWPPETPAHDGHQPQRAGTEEANGRSQVGQSVRDVHFRGLAEIHSGHVVALCVDGADQARGDVGFVPSVPAAAVNPEQHRSPP